MTLKRWHRRLLRVLVTSALFLLLLFVLGTEPIDRTPYFKTEYYRNTIEKINAGVKNMTQAQGELYTGFSKIHITPKIVKGTENSAKGEFNAIKMAGFGDGQIAKEVHDSLFAKAISIEIDQKEIVLISADMVLIPEAVVLIVSENLKDRIDRKQLFFGATHTHASIGNCIPGLVGKSFGGEFQPEVVQWLSNRFTQLVKNALENKQASKFSSAYVKVPNLTRNRIIGETGRLNDKLNLVSFIQKNGKKATIGVFSAHATTIGAWNDSFSGDYPGYYQRSLENNGVDLALFFAGTVGSHSNKGEGEKFDKAKYIGETLADSALALLKNLTYDSLITMASVSSELEVPKLQAFHISNGRRLSPMIGSLVMPPQKSILLQGLRLNNFVWIAMPYELSGEYGLDLKNALELQGYNSALTSFNGQYLGYIVPSKYYYFDTYETRLMGWYGPSMGDYLMELNFKLANSLTHLRL